MNDTKKDIEKEIKHIAEQYVRYLDLIVDQYNSWLPPVEPKTSLVFFENIGIKKFLNKLKGIFKSK